MTDVLRKRLCIIPVRSGSKGLPDKNIRHFLGKPLVCHSVSQAVESDLFDLICVSSDSAAYLKIAGQEHTILPVKRPDNLATDTAGSLEVVLHALTFAEGHAETQFETVCLLQATSPLRTAGDISGLIDVLENGPHENVVSVCKAKNSPYFNLVERNIGSSHIKLSKTLNESIIRRQDAPDVFQINGAVYGWKREALLQNPKSIGDKTGIFEMPAFRSLDIDDHDDWDLAEIVANFWARRNSNDSRGIK